MTSCWPWSTCCGREKNNESQKPLITGETSIETRSSGRTYSKKSKPEKGFTIPSPIQVNASPEFDS